jgi:hypothetical protein
LIVEAPPTATDFRIVDRGWVHEIESALAVRPRRVQIVAPFIKTATMRRFLQRSPAPEIELITRYNLNDFYAGVSDVEALRLVIESGGRVRGIRGLHSKLYLFDGRRVIAGSANLSEAALLRNHEFGFVSGEFGIISRCIDYFRCLWEPAGPDLTTATLTDWNSRVSALRPTGRSRRPNLPDYGAKVSLSAEIAPFVQGDGPLAADGQYFVKFFGSARERTSLDEPIEETVLRSGCHWACTYGKRPRSIDDGARMFVARLTRGPNDIRIFGQAIGDRHRDRIDDATDEDIRSRPWKRDWPYYVRVRQPEMLSGHLSDGVSLNELMNSFGENSFMSTQRNAARGQGNRNPRRSLSQQPQIELTLQAAAWLSSRLENAFRHCGMLDLSQDKFDWPKDFK